MSRQAAKPKPASTAPAEKDGPAAAAGIDLTPDLPDAPPERDFPRMERYEALRVQLADVIRDRFHTGKAAETDMDALAWLVEAVTAVANCEPLPERPAAGADEDEKA